MSTPASRFGRRHRARTALIVASFGLAVFATGACASADSTTFDIGIEHVLTLDGVGDSIDLSTKMPVRSANGFVAAVLEDPPSGSIGIFDSTGRFIRRIGRSGRGPGEFRTVETVGFGPGDSLWVGDASFFAHAFGPLPEATFARTLRLSRPSNGRITPYGILSGGIYTSGGRDGEGGLRHAHILDWHGELRWEFGAASPATDFHDRMNAPGLRDSAHAWVPYSKAYILELLGADGAVHGRVERSVPWLPGDTTNPDRRIPRAAIRAVSVDKSGNLWVLARRANPAYVPPDGPPLVANGPIEARRLPTFSYAERFEGVLEVLDPRDGRLLASRVVGGGVLGFPEPDLIYEVEQDDYGRVRIHLKRLSLQPRSARDR